MRRITTVPQLENVLRASSELPVLIFKHSTTCPVSAAALREFKQFSEKTTGVVHSIVHVIEERPVSNAIAEKTGVRHESPQAILIKNNEVLWHASHAKITADALQHAIAI
jgi:bacillithiol system protein YtxJ